MPFKKPVPKPSMWLEELSRILVFMYSAPATPPRPRLAARSCDGRSSLKIKLVSRNALDISSFPFNCGSKSTSEFSSSKLLEISVTLAQDSKDPSANSCTSICDLGPNTTFTGDCTRFVNIAAQAIAQAADPQDLVSPVPRSHTRAAIYSLFFKRPTLTKLTFIPSGKSKSFSIAWPVVARSMLSRLW